MIEILQKGLFQDVTIFSRHASLLSMETAKRN